MKDHIIPYDEIRSSLRTFDILNCIPNQGLFGWFWAWVGHTAMVYVCKETGQVMVYESTQTSRKDGQSGVQLRPMREWVERYPGKIYLRRVAIHNTIRRLNAEDECAGHIQEFRGTKYPDLKKPRWLIFLANAMVDLPDWVPGKKKLENLDTAIMMFCTHLLGHVFRWCGMINASCNPAELQPDDLRPGKDKRFVTILLNDGVSIGPEIQIK